MASYADAAMGFSLFVRKVKLYAAPVSASIGDSISSPAPARAEGSAVILYRTKQNLPLA
jgi:hypothetical protein